MAEPVDRRTALISKEAVQEIRKIAEEKLADLRKMVTDLIQKRDQLVDDSTLLSLGVAFVLGFALGVAAGKRRE